MLSCFVILVSQPANALKSHPYTSTKDNSHEITSLRKNRGRGPSVLRSHVPLHNTVPTRNLNTCNNSRPRTNSHPMPLHQRPRPTLPSLLHHSRFGTVPPPRTPNPKPQTTPPR